MFNLKKNNVYGFKLRKKKKIITPTFFVTESEKKFSTKSGRPSFTAKDILERKTTFHNKLISVVKSHHKVF